ncbi:hypothetical protein TWF730_010933 [Orbilia blumenaviensis]|uniref:Protein kinase domain-containing protein n=1 Tax=Orbilia blumenaviensis TaxID=1796055 RepID=A0AAV9UM66_9PEZI
MASSVRANVSHSTQISLNPLNATNADAARTHRSGTERMGPALTADHVTQSEMEDLQLQCGKCDFMAFLAAAYEFAQLRDCEGLRPFVGFEVSDRESEQIEASKTSGASCIVISGMLFRHMFSAVTESIGKTTQALFVVKKNRRSRDGTYFDETGMPHASNNGKWQARGLIFEVRVLSNEFLRKHPNIVKLLMIAWSCNPRPNPHLVFEHASHGNLKNLLQTHTHLFYNTRLKICMDVRNGLQALHSCNVIHRDIKLENVLIFEKASALGNQLECIAKLADFGNSFLMTDLDEVSVEELPATTSPSHRRPGSPLYAPPEYQEALQGWKYTLSDLYSYGILIWHTMLGFDALDAFYTGTETSSLLADGLSIVGEDSESRKIERGLHLEQLKITGKLLHIAKLMLFEHARSIIAVEDIMPDTVYYALESTLAPDLKDRRWDFFPNQNIYSSYAQVCQNIRNAVYGSASQGPTIGSAVEGLYLSLTPRSGAAELFVDPLHEGSIEEHFLEACVAGNWPDMKRILESRPNIARTALTVSKENALHFAHKIRDEDVLSAVTRLFESGASLSQVSSFSNQCNKPVLGHLRVGGPPIIRMIAYGTCKGVEAFLLLCTIENPCTLCQSPGGRSAAIAMATKHAKSAILELLITHARRLEPGFPQRNRSREQVVRSRLIVTLIDGGVKRLASSQLSPDLPEGFLRACLHGEKYMNVIQETFSILLRYGFYHFKDDYSTYLNRAIEQGNIDFCRFIIKLIPNGNLNIRPAKIDGIDRDFSATYLSAAIQHGSREIFNLIINRPDVDSQLGTKVQTPLVFKAWPKIETSLFEGFLRGRPQPHMDNYRLFYLTLSAGSSHYDTYFGEELIRRERLHNVHGELWWSEKRSGIYYRYRSFSPLSAAIAHGWEAMFKILLDNGALINEGVFPSHWSRGPRPHKARSLKALKSYREPLNDIDEFRMPYMAARQLAQPNPNPEPPLEVIRIWLQHSSRVPDNLIRAIILHKSELSEDKRGVGEMDKFWEELINEKPEECKQNRRYMDKRTIDVLLIAILHADLTAVRGILDMRLPMTPISWWFGHYIIGNTDPWAFVINRISMLNYEKAKATRLNDLDEIKHISDELERLELIAIDLEAQGYGYSFLGYIDLFLGTMVMIIRIQYRRCTMFFEDTDSLLTSLDLVGWVLLFFWLLCWLNIWLFGCQKLPERFTVMPYSSKRARERVPVHIWKGGLFGLLPPVFTEAIYYGVFMFSIEKSCPLWRYGERRNMQIRWSRLVRKILEAFGQKI